VSSSVVKPCALSASPSALNDFGANPMPKCAAAAASKPRAPRKSRPSCAAGVASWDWNHFSAAAFAASSRARLP